jgi:hypothetical protein
MERKLHFTPPVSYATVVVGPPPALQSERPLPAITSPSASRALQDNCFPIALPQSNSGGYSRRHKTRHITRTAAVIFITKVDQAASFNIWNKPNRRRGASLEEFFDPIHRRMLAVLDLYPVLRPTGLIRTVSITQTMPRRCR